MTSGDETDGPNLINWAPVSQKDTRCPKCRRKPFDVANRRCGLCLGTGRVSEIAAAAYALGGMDAVHDLVRGA